MKISENCKNMLIHHEGLRLKPYLCPAHIWTCGVGSVLYQDQIKLPIIRNSDNNAIMIRKEYKLKDCDNRLWSKDEVIKLLEKDLQRFERGVLRYCPAIATQGQFDALVSFSFNVGIGTLQRSTLRQKHNRGDFEGAANEFMKYSKAGGKVLKGLLNRRKDEMKIYLS